MFPGLEPEVGGGTGAGRPLHPQRGPTGRQAALDGGLVKLRSSYHAHEHVQRTVATV